MRGLKNNAGVTLIELLAVLAILAILISVAWPRFPAASGKNLEGTARTLATHLRYVQQEAIISGKGCSIAFYVFHNSYRLQLPEGNERVYLPEGISFEGNTSFPGNPPSIHFNNLGRPSSGGTVILKCKNDELIYIIVAPVNGRVRISSTPPEGW